MSLSRSRSAIERLGRRLAAGPEPADEDVAELHALLLEYGAQLELAVGRVRSAVGLQASARLKSTRTILEKLDRYGGSWLKSLQDVAGMRIVGPFDRVEQDAIAERVVWAFRDEARPPKVIDRRREPSFGYRAVHVVVFPEAVPVEVQIRTRLQHEWAEMFEKLADSYGRDLRYGGDPDHWMTADELRAGPEVLAEVYWAA